MVGRLSCSPRRGHYNCSYAVAIAVAANTSRLRWGRCARNCRYSNKVNLPSGNLTRGGTDGAINRGDYCQWRRLLVSLSAWTGLLLRNRRRLPAAERRTLVRKEKKLYRKLFTLFNVHRCDVTLLSLVHVENILFDATCTVESQKAKNGKSRTLMARNFIVSLLSKVVLAASYRTHLLLSNACRSWVYPPSCHLIFQERGFSDHLQSSMKQSKADQPNSWSTIFNLMTVVHAETIIITLATIVPLITTAIPDTLSL